MIQVHNIFICKPGNAGKVAKLMKTMPFDPVKGPYILTDMTGQFHRVISIHNYNDLADYEAETKKQMEEMKNMKETPESKQWENFNDMYVSGSREIYKVW